MRFACLLGNGLSIAFNAELSVQNLTSWLGESFRAQEALARFAREAGTPADNFERLLGPLDRVARSLPHLEKLREVAGEAHTPELVAALQVVADFASRVHDAGLGTVLGRVAEQGAAVESPEFALTIQQVCDALKQLNGRPVTVATLNYDALIPAAFIRLEGGDPWGGQAPADMADLGDGREHSSCIPIPDESLQTLELRAFADFPLGRKILLLNLHGSLSWLHDPSTGRMHKVKSLGALRDMDYWSKLRDGTALCRPLVVLTDQKDEVISQAPFNVAYDAFQQRLIKAQRWLIGGYGLGDTPVNTVLHDAMSAKRRLAQAAGTSPTLPRVLVVDKDCQVDERRRRIAELLDLPMANIDVEPAGFPDAVTGTAWAAWAQG